MEGSYKNLCKTIQSSLEYKLLEIIPPPSVRQWTQNHWFNNIQSFIDKRKLLTGDKLVVGSWLAATSVKLVKIIPGGFVGIELRIQIVLTGTETEMYSVQKRPEDFHLYNTFHIIYQLIT